MIKKITLLSFGFLSIVSGYAQKIELVSVKGSATTVALSNHVFAPAFQTEGGIQYLSFPDGIFTMQKGAPQLPVYRTSVQLPNTGGVSIEVTYSGYSDISNINVLPSKGSLMRNVSPKDVAYQFGAAYTEDAFYPANVAEAGTPYIMRDTRGVTLSVYPYQYNPVTKVLRHYKDITVKVVANSTAGPNHKTAAGRPVSSTFNQLYKGHYINAKTLDSGAAPDAAPAEMLIVAPDEFVETIAPLADWKIESGTKATVATLNETGYTAEEIKQYIQDFYAENPNLVYVLLVGDHEDTPSYSYGLTGANEELWSDIYYGQMEGEDLYPELFVGRFSGTVNDVATMVSRTLEYETAPLEGNWMTRFVGIGSNEGDGYGDDGEPDWQHLRNIGEKLMEYGYTYGHEFFDGTHGGNDLEESPSNVMISDAVNDGVGLINYTGHGATDVFATGWYTNDDVYGLVNNGMYPFIVSVACNNGTFAYGTSICEAWLATQYDNSPSGAIAACGSSILMAWAEPMQTQDEMAELIIRSNPDVVKRTMGELFYAGQVSMLQTYGESETAMGVMQTWVFFGDPSVAYRNEPNQALAATHPAQISGNAQTLTVVSDVEGATVAITQNGVIVGTAVVVNGQAVVTLTGFDASLPLTVTATMQNYTPYQGVVTPMALSTGGFSAAAIRMYPNPAGAQLTITHNLNGAEAAYAVYDVTGKTVFVGKVPAGDSFVLNTAELAGGVYLVKISGESGSFTGKFVKK
jgi:gingipain R